MTSDWRQLTGDMDVEEATITVGLARDRQHCVSIVEHADGWEASGYAADAKTLEAAGMTFKTLWGWNRYLDLVGYVVDDRGDAWVTAWIPRVGTTPSEFQAVIREVAVEADRLEYFCTGKDDL